MVMISSFALLSNIVNTDVDDLTMSCFTSDCWCTLKTEWTEQYDKTKEKAKSP